MLFRSDLADKQNIGNALQEVGYAKMIEAIHKVQGEMGITGTTSLEPMYNLRSLDFGLSRGHHLWL